MPIDPTNGEVDNKFFEQFWHGERFFQNWKPPKLRITSEKKAEMTDILCGEFGVPFVSEKFFLAMKDFLDGHCEFLPLGKIKRISVFLLNVVTLLDCLDNEKSSTEFCKERYVFQVEKVSAPIFRVPEAPSALFVTGEYAQEILKNKLTGVGLDDPTDIRLVKDKVVYTGFPT